MCAAAFLCRAAHLCRFHSDRPTQPTQDGRKTVLSPLFRNSSLFLQISGFSVGSMTFGGVFPGQCSHLSNGFERKFCELKDLANLSDKVHVCVRVCEAGHFANKLPRCSPHRHATAKWTSVFQSCRRGGPQETTAFGDKTVTACPSGDRFRMCVGRNWTHNIVCPIRALNPPHLPYAASPLVFFHLRDCSQCSTKRKWATY